MINHDPNRQVRGTVTKLETLPQTNHMSHPDLDPDRDPIQVRGTVTKLETLPQTNHMSHPNPDPDRDPVQVRGTVTKLETLPQTNHMSHPNPDPDRDPIQVRGTVTNLETLPQTNNISHPNCDPVQVRDQDSNLKFQGHHRSEGHYCQGYLTHLYQSVILLNNLCKGRKTRPRK